jgi:hypothetical protein
VHGGVNQRSLTMQQQQLMQQSDDGSNDLQQTGGAPLLPAVINAGGDPTGLQPIPVPAPSLPLPPIAALLQRLRSLKRVYLEAQEADCALCDHLALAVATYPQLLPELHKFGWTQPRTGDGKGFWSAPVDVQVGACGRA